MFEISEPMFFCLKIFSNSFLDSLSIDSGETASGRGLKLPLVISTSINAKDLVGNKKSSIKIN